MTQHGMAQHARLGTTERQRLPQRQEQWRRAACRARFDFPADCAQRWPWEGGPAAICRAHVLEGQGRAPSAAGTK